MGDQPHLATRLTTYPISPRRYPRAELLRPLAHQALARRMPASDHHHDIRSRAAHLRSLAPGSNRHRAEPTGAPRARRDWRRLCPCGPSKNQAPHRPCRGRAACQCLAGGKCPRCVARTSESTASGPRPGGVHRTSACWRMSPIRSAGERCPHSLASLAFILLKLKPLSAMRKMTLSIRVS